MLCPFIFNSNTTIELTVHTSCYCLELTQRYLHTTPTFEKLLKSSAQGARQFMKSTSGQEMSSKNIFSKKTTKNYFLLQQFSTQELVFRFKKFV